jgi:pSer/pThr/pTyr-binding forkhead associated (FHA) protein
MAIQLTITDLRNPDNVHLRRFSQTRVIIGRAKIADICLPDLRISTSHMEIRLENNDYFAIDSGSLNGTTVNDKKLIAHRKKKLESGDIIKILDYQITFKPGVSFGPVVTQDESTMQAREILSFILSNQPLPPEPAAIIIFDHTGKKARYELAPAPCTIKVGRGRGHHICIEDADISRNHAEISCSDDKITIKDLNSKNGIIVNGEKKTSFTLTPGEPFILGNTTLMLEHPLDPALLAIQSRPEEETSSFSLSAIAPLSRQNATTEQKSPDSNLTSDSQTAIRKDIPIGPEDPVREPYKHDHVEKNKEEQSVKTYDSSDLGMIIIGAIIVTGSVAALIWLFG